MIDQLPPNARRAREAGARRCAAAAAAILLAFGAWRAVSLAWICDDSFISFRYAENLIHGHGLVYNAGERVEGYSNLLWTLLVAAGMRAGLDPVRAAQGMGIASYLLLASLLAAWWWRRRQALGAVDGTGGAMVPVGAMVALAAHDFHVWATGGLETMFFALLGVAVLHSGGDFMFARRFIPVAPFVLLALESWIASIDRSALRWTLAVILISGALLPYPVFGEGRWRISGIADEPHFYPPEAVAARRAQGELMGELLGATPVRAMFEGGMCMFAYYSKLPYLVEMTGLTQYSLARLPIEQRGVIGHEKQPDDRWLEDHEIHLVVAQEWPISPPEPGARRHDDLYLGNLVKARVLLYSDAVMDPLRVRPEASFVPIEQVIALLRGEMAEAPYPRAAAILEYLDRYYLRTAGQRGVAIAVELHSMLDQKRRAGASASDPP